MSNKDTPYHARILTHINAVNEEDWDAHLPTGSHPFLSWRFLNALEESGCVAEETGWIPRHIWLEDETGQALGAAPLYVKLHSQGEYVFDHSWADALERAGGQYYPKLQSAVPFTPVTGPRLLAQTKAHKQALATSMISACEQWDLSGVHLTFLDRDDQTILSDMGFAVRQDRQFHFINRNYETFEDFLNSLSSRKRKNIKKERAAAQNDLTIKRLIGDDLRHEHWDIFYQCYLDTGQRKWGHPYLNRMFFDFMQETMREDICLVIAYRDDSPIAAALNFIGSDALYGRHWGCLEQKRFLHFELCYYQAIEAGLELGLARVEAGAQGEHKLARGYEPVTTHSAHYLTHPGLRDAIENYLIRERQAVQHEVKVLGAHTPFKKHQNELK